MKVNRKYHRLWSFKIEYFLTHSLKGNFWSIKGHITKTNKTEGLGVILSLLTSREFGFTFNLIDEQWGMILSETNKKRKNQHCLNEDAGTKVLGTSFKPLLNKNPFCRDFDHTKLRSSYWDSGHEVMQCKDCADAVCVLFCEKSV